MAASPDWSACACTREAFVALVRHQGENLYRDLPWRNIDDAYGVLVSEVMLQQTQVVRVQRYWQRWMSLFPTVDALVAADTATVLETWQGLGYNRRALALKRACEQCSAEFGGRLPQEAEELVRLPGIGPATAAGVIAFAYNRPSVYIETNVRSVFLHELFPDAQDVSDKQLAPYVADTCPDEGARSWYYALLDYGAHLKTQVGNPSRRSSHYARQSAFEGSRREKRSFILKCVLAAPDGISCAEVRRLLDAHEHEAARDAVAPELFDSIVADLQAEGFFHLVGDLLIP
ncbi:MAG: adenine glycosylase [Eggerthellaceae bacterium]|nr:adenine glycosylase [Eggerthellaceae bacterium]